mgnify:CR=1 FL=1
MRILVTGASGLLGLNLCLMQASRHDVIGVVHSSTLFNVPFNLRQTDLTLDGEIERLIDETLPDLVINCAALAAVDQCEDYPQVAHRLNAYLPGIAAARCDHHQVPFIHISTDAVFDGATGGYHETDQPNPLSVYAKTKLEGEKRVMQAHARALVARVNFYGHSLSGERSLAEFFLQHLLNGHSVNGFVDVFFSPLYARQLVEILMSMAEQGLDGLYHVVCGEKISKYDFGRQIAKRLSLDEGLVLPISYLDAGLKAKRSPNLFLDISKLQHTGITLPTIDEGLDGFISDFHAGWHTRLQGYHS